MIMKIRKMLLCSLAVQILFITLSAISYAAMCSNNWRSPSSQTMETEIMSASMTEYANIERYLSIKQGWKTTHIYFLQGVLLVKGLDDDEINYDNIFWYPMMFMQSGVLSKAFPQGPCSITQKTPMALTEAEGEVVPTSQGVIEYDYTLKGKQNVKHFKGIMKFTPKEAAPPDDTVVKGFKIVNRTKPYTVIGSKDMPVTTIGELRRALIEKKKSSKKWTGPIPEIIMAPEEKKDNNTGKELYPFHVGGERGFEGFVDKKGQVVIEAPCIIIGDFHDDIAICTYKDFKRGFINREGKVIFEPSQGEVGYHAKFSEGLAAVRKDKKVGFIDKNGKFVIEPQFSTGDCGNCEPSFSEGLAAVGKDMKWGFINKTGKFVIAPQFIRVCDFHEGLAAVANDYRKWGFINKQGELVIQPQFDYTPDSPEFSEGLAALKKNGEWGSINKKGEFVIEPQFDYHYKFYDGFASVCKNGVYFFIDKTGKQITEKYKPAYYFHDGLSVEEKDGIKGYIDKTGTFVIEPQFEKAGPFKNGVASVFKNGKWGLIDKSGKIFVVRDTVCGHGVLKNGKGEITWPRNIKELCGQKN